MDILCRSLVKHGFDAAQLHGDMAQSARTETLDKFRQGLIRLVVCSDVAARGLDVSDLSHVFNFDIPHHSEDYIHRIGRTGRAGKEGRAFSIATPDDKKFWSAIVALIGKDAARCEIEGLPTLSFDAAEDGGARRKRRDSGGPKREGGKPKRDNSVPKREGGSPKNERAAPSSRPSPRDGRNHRRDNFGIGEINDPDGVIGFGSSPPDFILRPVILPAPPPRRKKTADEEDALE